MKSPKIRFKGYIDAWEQRKFKDTFDWLQNNTVSRADLNYEGGTVKNVHYGDVLIKFGDYIDASCMELPFFNDESIAQKYIGSLLQDGDIIIADTAEDTTVGKCTEIQGSEGMMLISGLHTIPCRPKEKFAPKFMGYYLNSFSYHDQLIPLMQGTKVTSISKSTLQETKLLIPKSIDEQEKIGSYFSHLDNLITLHQRKCEETKTLKKYMLQKMFPQNGMNVPEIRFDGFTDAWEQCKLIEVCDYVDYRGKTPTKTETGIFLVTAKNVKNGYIDYDSSKEYISEEDYEDIMHRGKPEIGDVLITTEAPCGNVAQVNSASIALAQRIIKYRGHEKIVDNTYLKHYLLTPVFQKILTAKSSGGTVQGIKGSILHQQIIQYPTFDEQVMIGQYLDSLDHLIILHQQKCNELQKIKKFMLQNMFV